jgi:hypothetical protein
MKIKPISRYSEPQYPSRAAFLRGDADIGGFLPAIWKGKQAIISAIAAFILAGCTKKYISSRDVID